MRPREKNAARQSAQNNTRLFGYTVSEILQDPHHNHPALAESAFFCSGVQEYCTARTHA